MKTGSKSGKNDKKRKEKKGRFCSFHTLSPFKRGKKKIVI